MGQDIGEVSRVNKVTASYSCRREKAKREPRFCEKLSAREERAEFRTTTRGGEERVVINPLKRVFRRSTTSIGRMNDKAKMLSSARALFGGEKK